MKRKSMSALGVIITAIILVIVAVVVIFVFRNLITREAGVVGEQISSLGDCDCDGVRNFIDKCPCVPFMPEQEDDKLAGCPAGTSVPQTCSADLATLCKEKKHIGKSNSVLCPELS